MNRCADCLDEFAPGALRVLVITNQRGTWGEIRDEKTVCSDCAGWYRDKRGVSVVDLDEHEEAS